MQAAEYQARVARLHEWHPGTRSLFLALPDGVGLDFVPGQFLSLPIPAADGPPLVRPYSLASSPEDMGPLEICVDRVDGGAGSGWLFDRGVGDAVTVRGPFGTFALAEPPDAPLVFVANGTGIAPIRPMVRRALARGGPQPIHVLHGARTEAELLFASELADAARAHPRLRWEPLLAGTGWAPDAHPALEARVLDVYVRADARRDRAFWICGVGPMVGRLRDALRAAGYARRSVRSEEW